MIGVKVRRQLSTGRRRVQKLFDVCLPAMKTRRVSRRVELRKKMPEGAFAIPETRSFPIHDAYHATAALTHLLRTAGRHGPNPNLAKRVIGAVRKKWPSVVRCEADLVAKIRKAHRFA